MNYTFRGKKQVHFAFDKPFTSIIQHSEILNLIQIEWRNNKNYFKNYEIVFPRLIHSTKWKYDYAFLEKKMNPVEEEKIDFLIDGFLNFFKIKYSSKDFYFRITKSKSKSIHLLIRKKRSCLTEKQKMLLFKIIDVVSNSVHNFFSMEFRFIR